MKGTRWLVGSLFILGVGRATNFPKMCFDDLPVAFDRDILQIHDETSFTFEGRLGGVHGFFGRVAEWRQKLAKSLDIHGDPAL